MKVDWDRDKSGYQVTRVAAYEAADSGAVRLVADHIGRVAAAKIVAHHGTWFRRHNLPSPTIEVEHGRVDSVVFLKAEMSITSRVNTTYGADGRAVGIEFGHRYESKDKNPSGPWNESDGLGILADAASDVGLMNGVG